MPKPTKKKQEEKKVEERKPHPRYTQMQDKEKKQGKRPPEAPNGGSFGYLGRGVDYYSDLELERLGKGLVEWIQQEGNIWCKYFFLKLDYPMLWDMVIKLRKRSPEFDSYINTAIAIQEGKLLTEPYDHRKKKDGYHARWMLARYHKGEWEDKPIIIQQEDNEKLDTAASLIDHLQSKSDLNKADNKISRADKSIFETGADNA